MTTTRSKGRATRLSPPQQRALEAFSDGEPRNAYTARARLNTLRTLQSRGFLSSKGGVPPSIEWRLTEAGRAALRKASEG